jgi:hypothetical protein
MPQMNRFESLRNYRTSTLASVHSLAVTYLDLRAEGMAPVTPIYNGNKMATQNDNSASTEPIGKLIGRHFLEASALCLTIIGILAYGAGMSWYQGWYDMAGIPVEYFPRGVHEVIRVGLLNDTPWLWSLIALIGGFNYFSIISLLGAWRKVYKAKRARRAIADAAKAEREVLSFAARAHGPANKKWRRLGRRGNGLSTPKVPVNAGRLRRREVTENILAIMMSLIVFLISFGSYIFVVPFFSGLAEQEGRRNYLGTYAATTGKFPKYIEELPQYTNKIQELGCEYAGALKNYGTMVIDEKRKSAYILQASGSTFLLLSKDGLMLKSFGDSNFELNEAPDRPRASFLNDCR